MIKLRTTGLLVAAGLIISAPSSNAQDFSEFLGPPPSIGQPPGADPGMAPVFPFQQQDDARGQADTGESGRDHWSQKTQQNADWQYEHDNWTQAVQPPVRWQSAKTRQNVHQNMLQGGWGLLEASTDILSLDSVNMRAVPSASKKLGFKGGGWHLPVAPWLGPALPPTATTSVDLNIVE